LADETTNKHIRNELDTNEKRQPEADVNEVDLDIEFMAAGSWDQDMPARMRWLRENDPVHWSQKDGVFVVSRYDDVCHVSKNQQLFTSEQGVRPGNPAKLGLIDEGEPRHGNLRKLINRGFTPRMVKKLEVAFREITAEAIDAVAKDGECDFVAEIAVPLPLLLIAEMIGIHNKDRHLFHEWSDAMIAGDGNFDKPDIIAKAGAAFMAYSTYVTEIIEDRRRNPQDDLVSVLVGAKDDGLLATFEGRKEHGEMGFDEKHEALANDELVMLLVLLMVAGNETTRNALSGGMALLIKHPDQRQKLIDDPSLIPSACEEMVRYVSPVHSFSRTVLEDTELAGVPLKQGDVVLMLYPSANHDPAQFPDPEAFDVTRNPQHVGFGIGTHFCMGANLARMELRVAVSELLRRLPDMEFSAGGPVVVPSALVRTCKEMRVRFTPEAGSDGR
jgi:cytochrome P450 family 142 subfamily A polypeptide 1